MAAFISDVTLSVKLYYLSFWRNPMNIRHDLSPFVHGWLDLCWNKIKGSMFIRASFGSSACTTKINNICFFCSNSSLVAFRNSEHHNPLHGNLIPDGINVLFAIGQRRESKSKGLIIILLCAFCQKYSFHEQLFH